MTNQFNFLLKNNVALEFINQTSYRTLSILENELGIFQQYNILQAKYLWKRLTAQGGFGYMPRNQFARRMQGGYMMNPIRLR